MTKYFGTGGVFAQRRSHEISIDGWEFVAEESCRGRQRKGRGWFLASEGAHIGIGSLHGERLRLRLDAAGDAFLSMSVSVSRLWRKEPAASSPANLDLRSVALHVEFQTVGEWESIRFSEERFLRAILSTPRVAGRPNAQALIFADDCDEHGDPDSAAFWRSTQTPYSDALRRLAIHFGREESRVGHGKLVGDATVATAMAPSHASHWIAETTRSTGVILQAVPASAEPLKGDVVLSPADGVFLSMGRTPASHLLV